MTPPAEEIEMMDEKKSIRTISIPVDEFLTHTLHYALAEGDWNYGDGHVWAFDSVDTAKAKRFIKAAFARELESLFGRHGA